MHYSKLDQGGPKDVKNAMGESYGDGGQRRFYNMCLVFRCKPSKFVRDPEVDRDSGAVLDEPSPKEKDQMQMWKPRREAMLKSLQNCGLNIRAHYSRDRDEILVKVGASPSKLRDTAARLKYKLQLKKQYLGAYAEYRHDFPGRPERGLKDRRVISHIYRTHTEDDYPDSDSIFTTLDKIHLLHRIITSKDKDCAGINVGKMLHERELQGYFPLHEPSVLAEIKMNKLAWFMMPEEFANKVRDYFGDRIAFYFLFMAFYWKWLVPLALMGLALQLIDLLVHTPDNITAIPFCILMSVWATFLPYFWRRQEAKYAIGWGTLDLVETLEPCRPEHHGDPRINPVTAQVENYFPWQKRIKYYAINYALMAVVVGACIMALLFIVLTRHNMKGSSSGGILFFQLLLATYVEVMNVLLTKLANRLTVWENHRTQSDHDTHMLAKVVVIKFVNCYSVLYYTAFFKHHHYLFSEPMECLKDDCFIDLQFQLATFVLFRLTASNLFEWLEPKVKLWWRSLFLERKGVVLTLQSPLGVHSLLDVADMSRAEQESKREKYDEFKNFDEILLAHGFATFFAVTSPWVCAANLFAVLIEIALDMRSLLENRQRPIPVRARSNEPWSSAFDVYGVLAASTNILLLIFASDQYESWTFTEKLVLFIYLEHMLLLSRIMLRVIFPEVPRNVELLQLKQAHMVHRCLENIKVEQTHDFSMFRDNRGETIEVFEHDIFEAEEEEDLEPTLQLWESGKTMVTGFQDAGKDVQSWMRTKR